MVNSSIAQDQPENSTKNNPELVDNGLNKIIKNIDFKDTDFRDVIRSIATKYSWNIFVDNSISMSVTLHLSNVNVYDAIKFIVEEKNLRLVETGNILKILPQEKPLPKPKKIIVEYENGNLPTSFNGWANDRLAS